MCDCEGSCQARGRLLKSRNIVTLKADALNQVANQTIDDGHPMRPHSLMSRVSLTSHPAPDIVPRQI